MPPLVRRIASEPLVHFLLIGGLLFALERLVRSPADERTIRVSDALRSELADGYSHEQGRAPSEDELDELVETWLRDEVLYREGLARGLDRGDPGVRSRIASSMAFVLDARARVPEPTDEQLRAYFDANAARWSEDELVDFTHVFIEGADEAARARALEVLDRLRAGASPGGLGDTFSGGRRYRRRRVADLAGSFGDEFAEGLGEQPEGAWELRRSRFGLHLVRIDSRSAASAARFDDARVEVTEAWREAQRTAAVQREIDALRQTWHVVEAP